MSREHEVEGGRRAAADSVPPLHSRSFKLRFAPQRELGRSYMSAVKPLQLPAVVSGKFYRRESEDERERECARRALRRVTDMFQRGPRQQYDTPITTSHQYGWWWDKAPEQCWSDRRLNHHIQDSAWLKERLRVLATDTGFKRQ